MQLSIERVVTILTPAFAAASGWVVGAVAQLAPGVQLNAGDITALQIAGVTAGAGAALKWLHGRQKFTQFESDTDQVVGKLKDAVAADQPAHLALSDIEQVLKAHTAQILTAVGNAVHAPPSAQEVAQQILGIAAGNAQGGSSTPDPTGGGSGSSAATDPGSTSQTPAPADPVPVPPAPLSAG